VTTAGQNEALYLYYVTGCQFAGDIEGEGINDVVLFAHRCANFVSLLGTVPLDDFCGTEAERNLRDLGWVGERALRHQRVIEQGFRRGPVLPARFGTLFSSLSAFEQFIDANRQTISDFLERVQGQEEWGVKVLLERSIASKWMSAQIVAAASGKALASPGLRYIEQRRAEAAAENQLQRWLLEACESITEFLDQYAIDHCQGRILDAGVGDSRELVLNLAALIAHEHREDLIAHIENMNVERAEQGLSLMLNGPWPPYSFCPPLATP
jgi:Gas vesicle synthesis protein GvpL/GvpF